jgi:transposase InsO family protein
MCKARLRGCTYGRSKGTTRRANRAAPTENLVEGNFAATQHERVRVADITYIATQEGFL